jgi:hypothetical protein
MRLINQEESNKKLEQNLEQQKNEEGLIAEIIRDDRYRFTKLSEVLSDKEAHNSEYSLKLINELVEYIIKKINSKELSESFFTQLQRRLDYMGISINPAIIIYISVVVKSREKMNIELSEEDLVELADQIYETLKFSYDVSKIDSILTEINARFGIGFKESDVVKIKSLVESKISNRRKKIS